MTQRNYWAVRTSRDHQDFIFEELRQGRLRQGWGYKERLNAETLQARCDRKGWALDDEERAAWPNWRLAAPKNGGVKVGDIILAPNLPEDGKFCLAEVTGEYSFQIHAEKKDFGHILPVRLLTPKGVANRNRHVDASIRHTLKARSRMWNLHYYKECIDKLIEADDKENLHKANDPEEQLTEAVTRATGGIREVLWKEVQKELQAGEWEGPLRQALSQIYPGADVQARGGPNEQGMDLLIQWPNPFDEHRKPFVIPVQIKNYDGTHEDPEALDQIEHAVHNLKGDNIILAAIILSTADTFGENFDSKRKHIQEKVGVPMIAALRPQVLDILLAAHLAMRFPAAQE